MASLRCSWELLRSLADRLPLRVRVRGDCMAPAISDGARVELRRALLYLPGDVVAFRSPGGALALHRALGYRLRGRRPALVVQADAAALPDAPIELARLLGRAEAVITANDERQPLAPRRLFALGRFARYLGAALGRRLRG